MGKERQTPIDQSLLQKWFDYQDGHLVWKIDRGTAKKGDKAHSNGNEYKAIKLFGIPYLEHRLIWIWHGFEINGEIDHIDCNPMNNRIENLRLANRSENMRNASIRSDNKSGVKGVSWCKSKNKWKVQLCFDGKQHFLGRYENLSKAKEIVEKYRDEKHLNFANHGA